MHAHMKKIFLLLLVSVFCCTHLMAAFCAGCGRKLPPDAKFCPACGTRVKAKPTPELPVLLEPRPATKAPAASKPATPAKPAQPAKPARQYRHIPEADKLFARAESLRTNMNPFRKKSNYKKAIKLYKKILAAYPDSDRFEHALFQLGNINESVYYSKYRKAADYYRKVIAANPDTSTPARFRLADLCMNQLGDRKQALRWYREALKHKGGDEMQRMTARNAVAELEKEFGKEVAETAAAAPKSQPVRPRPASPRPAARNPASPVVVKPDQANGRVPLSPNQPRPGEDFSF